MPGHGIDDEEKPCRACSDFKTWAKQRKQNGSGSSSTKTFESPHKQGSSEVSASPPELTKRGDCPLDKDELGKSTWGFLHSMASYFPDYPTKIQSENMSRFFYIFAQFYPCEPCALDFQEDIMKNPPMTKSREELAKWLCERHNTVNKKLNKPIFDCSKVRERWRDGWLDGSCD
ncbi:FAD-linked sulfhydryl oxidase ALR [Plodia interpunctella]|uniref:FAD-linked sulfhydryl oxidase ALR n=1 Tax=Plodia interpunctella TaxID=58824 RepID=UPI00236794BA|nr:FAD-linked sulfhydryl oxidase ALR [Plodia interpunctella]